MNTSFCRLNTSSLQQSLYVFAAIRSLQAYLLLLQLVTTVQSVKICSFLVGRPFPCRARRGWVRLFFSPFPAQSFLRGVDVCVCVCVCVWTPAAPGNSNSFLRFRRSHTKEEERGISDRGAGLLGSIIRIRTLSHYKVTLI